MKIGTRGTSLARGAVSALVGGVVVAGALEWAPCEGMTEVRQEGLRGWFLAAGLFGGAVTIGVSRVLARCLTPSASPERGAPAKALFASGREAGPATENFGNRDVDALLATLEDERDRLSSVLEGMDSAVLALDPSGRIILANRATASLPGLGEDPVGKPLEEVLDVPELLELFRGLKSEEGDVEFEVGDPPRMFLGRLTGAGTGGVLVVHDVTESKKLDKVRRDFVANVSHELRTPVAVIQANAETLLGGALEDREQAVLFTEAVMRNARRLTNLISDLLDLTRIESGKYEIQNDEINLERLVRRIGSVVESGAMQKGVTLTSEVPSDAVVVADPKALEQILINYVENAIKYGPEGGRIVVMYRLHRQHHRIEVADEGEGIEAQHRDRLFERFYRIDKGRSRYTGGTGLGLSIVKHLAGAMGGRVGIDCPAGGGSVFWVELPRRRLE